MGRFEFVVVKCSWSSVTAKRFISQLLRLKLIIWYCLIIHILALILLRRIVIFIRKRIILPWIKCLLCHWKRIHFQRLSFRIRRPCFELEARRTDAQFRWSLALTCFQDLTSTKYIHRSILVSTIYIMLINICMIGISRSSKLAAFNWEIH